MQRLHSNSSMASRGSEDELEMTLSSFMSHISFSFCFSSLMVFWGEGDERLRFEESRWMVTCFLFLGGFAFGFLFAGYFVCVCVFLSPQEVWALRVV